MSAEHGHRSQSYDLSPYQERGISDVAYRLPLGQRGERYIGGDAAQLLHRLSGGDTVSRRALAEESSLPLSTLDHLVITTNKIVEGTPYSVLTAPGRVGKIHLGQRDSLTRNAEIEAFETYTAPNGTDILLRPDAKRLLSRLTTVLQTGGYLAEELSLPKSTISKEFFYLQSVIPPESGLQVVSKMGTSSGYLLKFTSL